MARNLKLHQRLTRKEGKGFAGILTRVSEHLEDLMDGVKILLNDPGRRTYSYYVITGLRPVAKTELYLSGMHHHVMIAEEDGEPGDLQLIVERADS